MKIFLFGGAEGNVRKELKMIEKIIRRFKPQQVLHIPFARVRATEVEWMGNWFGRHIELAPGTKYLNARREIDLAKVKSPLIFISGGHNPLNLITKLRNNSKLLGLVKNASCIIGESSGAKILGEYFSMKGNDNNSPVAKGLGIIKNTVIEPHYIQRQRQELLIKDMDQTGVKYGLGIDSLTAVELDVDQFPKKIKKIGKGKVVLITL